MFKKNPNLRIECQEVQYTEDLINEYIKCKEDIIYFAENYFYIIDPNKGKTIIKLREYQKRMIKAFMGDEDDGDRRHVVCLSSRQIGKCCSYDTTIRIRNKNTGEIREMVIGDFFEMIKKVEWKKCCNDPIYFFENFCCGLFGNGE